MAKRITLQQIERWKQEAEEWHSRFLAKGERDGYKSSDLETVAAWRHARISDGGTFDKIPPNLRKTLNECHYSAGFARVTDMPEF